MGGEERGVPSSFGSFLCGNHSSVVSERCECACVSEQQKLNPARSYDCELLIQGQSPFVVFVDAQGQRRRVVTKWA